MARRPPPPSRYLPPAERTRYQKALDRAGITEILVAMREEGGNHERAADALGLSLRQLHREIDRLGIREKTRGIHDSAKPAH